MLRSTLTLLALAGITAAATAQDHGRESLRELVAESQLAFRGEVIGIQYANSMPAADAPEGIPHTFVTYRVDQLFHGAVDSPVITLRFMGGWDPATETFLDVSLAPQFDLGDQDILFVRGNGELGAPLVGNHDGRLRVSGGQVYSDSGREVRIDDLGRIAMGERYDLPEVGSVEVLGHTLWIGFDPEAIVGPSNAITGEAFSAAVARTASLVPAPAVPFESAVFGEAFESPFPAPTLAPEFVKGPADEDELDAETIAEIMADESGLGQQYREQLKAKAAAKK